jgi:hypothetical protein
MFIWKITNKEFDKLEIVKIKVLYILHKLQQFATDAASKNIYVLHNFSEVMQHFQAECAAAERVGCSETVDGLKPRGPRPQRRPRCERRRRHPWRRRLCLFSRVPCQRPTSIRQRGGPVYVGYKQQPQTASSCFEATPVAVAARGVAWRWCEGRRGAQRGPELLDGPVAARTATWL